MPTRVFTLPATAIPIALTGDNPCECCDDEHPCGCCYGYLEELYAGAGVYLTLTVACLGIDGTFLLAPEFWITGPEGCDVNAYFGVDIPAINCFAGEVHAQLRLICQHGVPGTIRAILLLATPAGFSTLSGPPGGSSSGEVVERDCGDPIDLEFEVRINSLSNPAVSGCCPAVDDTGNPVIGSATVTE